MESPRGPSDGQEWKKNDTKYYCMEKPTAFSVEAGFYLHKSQYLLAYCTLA